MPRDSSSSRSEELRIPGHDQVPACKPAVPISGGDLLTDQAPHLAPAKFTEHISAFSDANDHCDSLVGTNDAIPSPLSFQKARDAVSKFLEGKDQEVPAVIQKRGPLTLLDMPVDILHEIVKEVTHTNDLAALALTHSALHALAIPQIYSRFDIVWPDSNAQSEPRVGVDALTYGLATLVMAEDVFHGNSESQQSSVETKPICCSRCGCASIGHSKSSSSTSNRLQRKRRRGNYYAEFTRKFSLGNGPTDWVQEYMVTKESGKMLGTLVALAVARMRRLETFTWDMPTGILQDVWDSLASHGEHTGPLGCRLEKIWVRWHNSSKVEGNYEAPVPPPRSPFMFWAPYSSGISGPVPQRYLNKRNRVERPTFSALPPLKSLSVLDIDECAYLDEMSRLIGKSQHCLRELRVGIAEHAVVCEWAHPWEGTGLSQHPKDKSVLGTSHWERRLGGVIGVLVKHIFDARNHSDSSPSRNSTVHEEMDDEELTSSPGSVLSATLQTPPESVTPTTSDPGDSGNNSTAPKFVEELQPIDGFIEPAGSGSGADNHDLKESKNPAFKSNDARLALEVLELERVALSNTFLAAAFDWHTIRDLTVLNCPGHAGFWTLLRREHGHGWSVRGGSRASENKSSPQALATPQRRLSIRKIHTNTVSTQLLNFIRDLEPNTLEVLFLQQSSFHTSTVGIQSIMRAVRHHRGSLRKLMIDSSQQRLLAVHELERWMMNREMVHFLSSGRMPKLRELGVAIDHKDWHHLLQRLPRIPHIRSLNLPFIVCADGSMVVNEAAREHALQIIDIITLRPDIELCYLGIGGKCFEILESRVGRDGWKVDESGKPDRGVGGQDNEDADDEDATADVDEDADDEGDSAADGEEEDDDDDADEEDAEDNDDDDHESDDTEDERDPDASAHGHDDSDWDDEDGAGAGGKKPAVRFDVREILFYDDKVAIFKARHGRL